MSIISTKPTPIENYETQNVFDVDETATKILGLREFVVLSYEQAIKNYPGIKGGGRETKPLCNKEH